MYCHGRAGELHLLQPTVIHNVRMPETTLSNVAWDHSLRVTKRRGCTDVRAVLWNAMLAAK